MSISKSFITYSELSQLTGLENNILVDILEYEIVMPVEGVDATQWTFDVASIQWVKRAIRLHKDFQIDWLSVALVIDLLRENEALKKENESMQRQLKRLTKPHAF